MEPARAQEGTPRPSPPGPGPGREAPPGLPGPKPFPGCLRVCLVKGAERGKLNIVFASPPVGARIGAEGATWWPPPASSMERKRLGGKGVDKMAASGSLVWREGGRERERLASPGRPLPTPPARSATTKMAPQGGPAGP